MKDTKLYFNGKIWNVFASDDEKDTVIYRNYGNYVTEVARGSNLKEACLDWFCKRNCNDDINTAFESSKIYLEHRQELFKENMEGYNILYDECFSEWLENLDGLEMFAIMRDGTYHNYVEWSDIDIEEDEENEEEE